MYVARINNIYNLALLLLLILILFIVLHAEIKREY